MSKKRKVSKGHPTKEKSATPSSTIRFDEDKYGFIQQQLSFVLTGQLGRLSRTMLDELISQTIHNYDRELMRRTSKLFNSLLQFKCATATDPDSATKLKRKVIKHRKELDSLFIDSPSMLAVYYKIYNRAYFEATEAVAKKLGIPRTDFPHTCPWKKEDVIDEDFFPA